MTLTDSVTKQTPGQKVVSVADQSKTFLTTTDEIMRSAAFAEGVDDVQSGRAPDYDKYCQDEDEAAAWNYERGRQFGRLAPPSMPLKIYGRTLNPKAVALFDLAYERRLII
jgi:hypothetical protein